MQIKLIIFVTVLTLITTVIGGSYYYYKSSQETITELNQKNAALNIAIEEQKRAIESIQQSLQEQTVIRENIQKEVQSARKDVDILQNKLSSHDFKKIAAKKPTLLEKRINTATDDVIRCFEIVTGNKVEQNETNHQCPDLIHP
jgi:Na+-transporting NADH:ubiquinone oxidoreductase subunit NqrC